MPVSKLSPLVGDFLTSSWEVLHTTKQVVAAGTYSGAMATYDFVLRPFQDLPGETDWVALREIIPAGTATIHTTPAHGGNELVVTSVLPNGWAGLHRNDGVHLIALQTLAGSGDASRDVAQLIAKTLAAPVGTSVDNPPLPTSDLRLQEMLVAEPFAVELHDGFDFWLDEESAAKQEVKAAVTEADKALFPTKRIDGIPGAYWCRMGQRCYVRWVRGEDEDALLDALARVHGARRSDLGGKGKVLGAFRAQGLLIPVWEVDSELEVAELAESFAAMDGLLTAALAVKGPLDSDARRARAGLVSRQVTLR